ncbi:hypothetical protein ABNE94_21570 [Paenibacillus larvae]
MNMFKKGFTVVLSVALSATLVLPSYSAYAETGSIPTEQEKEQAKQVAEKIKSKFVCKFPQLDCAT